MKSKGYHRPSKLWDGPGEKKAKPKRVRKKTPGTTTDFYQDPASTLFTDPIPTSDAPLVAPVFATPATQTPAPIAPPTAAPVAPSTTAPIAPALAPSLAGLQPDQGRASSARPDYVAMGPPPTPQENDQRAQWESDAAAALSRAIQSSPARPRAVGSEDCPIELDDHLTPKPLRRLLFPSPRKDGSFKTLDEDSPKKSMDNLAPTAPNPVERVEKVQPTRDEEAEQPDKENQAPPITPFSDDGLSHLFDFPASPQASPNNPHNLAQIIKTPASKSKGLKVSPTPRMSGSDVSPLPGTPSRIPRSSPVVPNIPQSSPFTLRMNHALSGSMLGSPSQNFSFNLNFSTPGALRSSAFDFNAEEYFGTDLPLPSSPPIIGTLDYDNPFEFYEDSTATVGIGGDLTSPTTVLTTQTQVTTGSSGGQSSTAPMPEFASILSDIAQTQTSLTVQNESSASAVADSQSVNA